MTDNGSTNDFIVTTMTQKYNNNQDSQHNNPEDFNSDNEEVNIENLENDILEAEPDEEAQIEDEPVSELDTLKAALAQKDEDIAKEKKEYMFLMAEFDNFRKRTLRERTELIKNASEKVLQGLLPIVDDFERGLDATCETTGAEAVKEGMVLIYNKLVKYLGDNGVKVMESTGAGFDPEIHEAVAMVPADDETPAGTVKDTVQKGYTLNDKVLRHAKVVVAQ